MRRVAHSRDVRFAVRAEEHFVRGLVGLSPFPACVRGPQVGGAANHSFRALWMSGDGIFRAAGIVKDDHLGCRTRCR